MLTPTTWGLATDVYTSLTSTSGNITSNASGLQLGMVVEDPNTGHYRMLVQCNPSASASLKINGSLKFVGTTIGYVVDMTSATTDFVCGFNDNAGVVIPAGNYFWMTTSGPVTMLVQNAVTANTAVTPSTTTGTLQAITGTNVQTNLLCIAGNASGTNSKVGWQF